MALKDDILFALLNSSDYVSGEELAKKSGKSRAGVWKAVKSLISDGYEIDAVTNKGYRLVECGDIISAPSIKKYINGDIDVVYFPLVDSTNNRCKQFIADGKNGEFLVVAEQQSAGRGRQGKSFYSPSGTGVYFSLALAPQLPLQNAVTATTAAAVAVCKAIEKNTNKKPKIKWVNDVYLDGKKICGILTEAITNFEEGIVNNIIIGIGINISTDAFPNDVENAGCLGENVNRSRLIADICNELVQIANGDIKGFIDYYRSHSLVLGEKIKFIKNGETTHAIAAAIDEMGGLEVELETGERTTLRSGEITVRKI